jgi:hypothetical protein
MIEIKTVHVPVDKSVYDRKDHLKVKWSEVIDAGLDKLEKDQKEKK